MSDIIKLLLKKNKFQVKKYTSKSTEILVRYEMRHKLRDDVQKELTSMNIEWKQERKTNLSSFDVTTFTYQNRNYTIIYKPPLEGKFAGAIKTSKLESAQAYYCAAAWNGSTEFTEEDLKSASNKVFATETVDYIIKNLSEDWIDVSVNVAKKLHKEFGNKQYFFHRGSDWVASLESNFKALNKVEKRFSNVNKWNPSDIYLVSPTEQNRNFNFKSILEMNSYLNNNISTGNVLPISLKKAPTGEPKVSYVNYNTSRPTFKYTGYEIGGFFNSKSMYLKYDGGMIQFRTFPNYAGEVSGKYAAHGKIGLNNINQYLQQHLKLNIESQRSLKVKYQKDPSDIAANMYEYHKYLSKNVEPFDKFMQKFKSASYDWVESKYLGLQIIFAIESGKEKADRIISDFLAYASSQTEYSAPYIKVE